jgi:tRNA(adenine34) deaminase
MTPTPTPESVRLADEAFMQIALQLAQQAAAAGEVPVGAVVVKNGVVVGTGHNSPIHSCDPSAHAEINALRMAASTLGNYRLEGCTLYVTLEPCAMCCGAMLHSRIGRVVFGAAEPKTGCAGSVLNLFAHAPLNHQTAVEGGVLAAHAALQLQDFFRGKRAQQREDLTPLREDALRTPERFFEALVDDPWPPHYVSDLPSLAGLRLHYLDLGPTDSQQVFLCLHPIPGWSYSLRAVIQPLAEQGARVVAPDLIGFGKSDKPKRQAFHTADWHLRCLRELMARLDLHDVVLVVPEANHPLATALVSDTQYRIKALMVQPCNPTDTVGMQAAGLDAPYPDAGHRAGERAFAAKRK